MTDPRLELGNPLVELFASLFYLREPRNFAAEELTICSDEASQLGTVQRIADEQSRRGGALLIVTQDAERTRAALCDPSCRGLQ